MNQSIDLPVTTSTPINSDQRRRAHPHGLCKTAWTLAALLCAVLALLPDGALAQAAGAAGTSVAPAATGAAAPAVIVQNPEANPYGLRALWAQGDLVAKGTLLVMLLMSLGSWTLIVTRLLAQQRMLRSARAAEAFWKAPSVQQGLQQLEPGSPLRFVAEQGIRAEEHHEGTMVEAIDKRTWVGMSVDRAVAQVNSRLQDGLAFLATVGSTAPFVGLFGTVWGIYNALVKIGVSGQASIDRVAGPVGEALIMTAIGLFVAVPAVMGYNALVRRNRTVMEQTRAFAADLQNVLIAGRR
jgi:biopolymer transport protein ExbB